MITNKLGVIKSEVQKPNLQAAKKNLTIVELVERAVVRGEGELTSTGALSVSTGKFTGRSPKDKYIILEPESVEHIAWGAVNKELSPKKFEQLYRKALAYMEGRELYVFDGYAGADPDYRLPIRIVNEYAWHNLFAHQMFIRPSSTELKEHEPEFTVIALPGLQADPVTDGTASDTFIVISFSKRTVLIGGTHYAGEMKKSIFSVLNYLLPLHGVLPMHCSANVGDDGDVALFFGLSGTGKTTLSADPERKLIGDDEHGWSDRGIFNFEGGCYAKCIGLSEDKEPQIWNAIRFGSVLENVVTEPSTRVARFDDNQLTENTRAAYPIDYIPRAIVPGTAGHPEVILFLTADAFGILPPVAKLTKDQAMYYFLSGYTSKLAGTERGITEPEATFSTCFGAPFLPMRPEVYARMLGEKITKHNTRVYLVNTGWTEGAYGVGKRINLDYTRAMVRSIIDGSIEEANFTADPLFKILVPNAVQGVPNELLQSRNGWKNQAEFEDNALSLAKLFAQNFEKFHSVLDTLWKAGPIV